MATIVFATGNQGKLREIRQILRGTDFEVISMKEAGCRSEIIENGTTFLENALIKARTICRETGCITMADDSGLVIDALGGEPGIYSARYMGEDTSYEIKNAELIRRLEGVPEEKRTARFVCALVTVFPDGHELTAEETFDGLIGHEARGENGFGYDPILYLPEYGRTSAELTPDEKNAISHRGKALRKMRDLLAKEGEVKLGAKVLVVSDTHGSVENFKKAVEKCRPFDLVIHCGDTQGEDDRIRQIAGVPCVIVRGNCPGGRHLPEEEIVTVSGIRCLVEHGHMDEISWTDYLVREKARAKGCQVAFCGHTHIPRVNANDSEVAVVNPGSLERPRQERRKPTFIVMTVDRNGSAMYTVNTL